jgi:hypothetical protein
MDDSEPDSLAPEKYTQVPIEQRAWWVPGSLLTLSRTVKSVSLTGTCSNIPRFSNSQCGRYTDCTTSAPEKRLPFLKPWLSVESTMKFVFGII